ncbi:MAG: AMP-binding protein [Lentilitoribacter sp.]
MQTWVLFVPFISGETEPTVTGRATTLPGYIWDLVQANPDGEFIGVDLHGHTTVKTYAAQFEKALLIASRLDENVHSTAPILLCYSTISEYIPAAWACLLSGREFHPCSPALLYRDKVAFWEQFDRSMMSMNADAVLSDAETATTLRTIAKEQDSAATIDDTSSWAMQGQPKSHILYENLTPANVYIQTSGSTGIPKLACISGDTLMHRFYDGIGPDNRVMLNVLASHSIGGMRTLLPLGRANIFLEPARLMALPQS